MANKTLYVTTPYRGFIQPLKMYGPVVNPIAINEALALELVYLGMQVNLVDPASQNVEVLTIDRLLEISKEVGVVEATQEEVKVNPFTPEEVKEETPAKEVKVAEPKVAAAKEETVEEVKETVKAEDKKGKNGKK